MRLLLTISRRIIFLIGVPLLFIGCAPRPQASTVTNPISPLAAHPVSPMHIYTTLSFLAHDSLNGRMAGTRENLIATAYIAGQFQQMGLQPFRSNSFKNTFYVDRNDSTITHSNVIAWLPGRSKPGEIIMISAHFDHVQAGRPSKGDKIYNGANDNASGTAAMLAMANYYALTRTNERSLLFCAFNAEESGLLGSFDFASTIHPDSIVAGINLEMLGVPQFGKNNIVVTGMKRSGLPDIMQKNLKGSEFRLRKERGEDLFERSDNYAFAVKGVPAHSFMASDDTEKCYHSPCDELKRMDTENMARLVEALITGISTIVSGRDTPSRIIP
jgi:Zn-dependent M28 family amino/carboxypeptidase